MERDTKALITIRSKIGDDIIIPKSATVIKSWRVEVLKDPYVKLVKKQLNISEDELFNKYYNSEGKMRAPELYNYELLQQEKEAYTLVSMTMQDAIYVDAENVIGVKLKIKPNDSIMESKNNLDFIISRVASTVIQYGTEMELEYTSSFKKLISSKKDPKEFKEMLDLRLRALRIELPRIVTLYLGSNFKEVIECLLEKKEEIIAPF